MSAKLLHVVLNAYVALAINPDCPNVEGGCTGTAVDRAESARIRARDVDLNRPWPEVRDSIVQACGLRVQQSTSHCFNDFNHVDCCTMDTGRAHNTNEESRVVGMHHVNYLGAHIVDASIADRGTGGSWCTCHISSPEDVCHKQFGARTAFKLVWCRGSGVAALLDDWANVLASGKPTATAEVPMYGGARARRDSWRVLDASRNESWRDRWRGACDAVEAGAAPGGAASVAHDEL